MKRTLSILAVLVVSTFLTNPRPAQAVVLAAEDFTGYSSGAVNGQGAGPSFGFSGAWATTASGGSTSNVDLSAGLNYLNYIGGFGGPGARLIPAGPNVDSRRTLSAPISGPAGSTTYFSFLVNYDSLGATSGPTSTSQGVATGYLMSTANAVTLFGNYGNFGSQMDIPLLYNSNVLAGFSPAPPGGYAQIVPDVTNLVVMKIVWDAVGANENISVFWNPNLTAGEAGNTPYVTWTTKDLGTINRIAFGGYNGGTNAIYDGFRLSTEWADFTVPEPSSISLCLLGLGFLAVRRKRAGR